MRGRTTSCPVCGHPILSGMTFCPGCGTNVKKYHAKRVGGRRITRR